MTEEVQFICVCALSILQTVCRRICNGDISVRELEEIQKRAPQLNKLCIAAGFNVGKMETDIAFINASVEQRLKEYEHFKVYHQQLHHLMSHLSSVPVQGT